MFFRQIADRKLAQYAYLLGCQETGEAIIIDPQRDIGRYVTIAEEAGLHIVAAADTHIHADYLSGLRQMATQYDVKIYASDEGGIDWRYQWLLGSKIDYQLLKNGDSFRIGSIGFETVHTPGHSPEHLSFAVTDYGSGAQLPMGILSGDFLLVGDVGRPDLLETAAGEIDTMESSARELFRSLKKVKNWPANTMLWPGHGAGSACGRSQSAVPISTIGYELTYNQSLILASNEEEFVSDILDGQQEPPYYFERMKRENRSGPSILHYMTEPKKLSAEHLCELISSQSVLLLDTRSWYEYKASHIEGSLFTPLNRAFTTIAGSYVPEGKSICLLVNSADLNEAILDLVRIGLDDIIGYVTPDIIEEYQHCGGRICPTEEIDVVELSKRIGESEKYILDVRRASELREIGKIAGAINVSHTRLLPDNSHIPRDKEVYVYCRSGNRSTYACGFLESVGVKVVHVASGITAWIGSGYQVDFDK